MGHLAGQRRRRHERVGPRLVAVVDEHQAHRLVPRRPRRVVRRAHAQHVARLDADAPARRRDRHRHVPRDRAVGVEVPRVRAEQRRGPAAALGLQIDPQAAGVQVPGRGEQRHVARRPPGVAAPPVGIGARLVARVREAAVATAAALDVEHGVRLAVLDVEPEGVRRLHRAPGRGVRAHDVHLVLDRDEAPAVGGTPPRRRGPHVARAAHGVPLHRRARRGVDGALRRRDARRRRVLGAGGGGERCDGAAHHRRDGRIGAGRRDGRAPPSSPSRSLTRSSPARSAWGRGGCASAAASRPSCRRCG